MRLKRSALVVTEVGEADPLMAEVAILKLVAKEEEDQTLVAVVAAGVPEADEASFCRGEIRGASQ